MNKIITYSFCEPFMDRLADDIQTRFIKAGKDLSRLAIVFGGKRPALFLKRELAKRIKGSFYPPRFFTIDELIVLTIRKRERFTGAGNLDSCYLLYRLAKETVPEILAGRERFVEFLPWTREILRFIDQIDLELIDDKSLLNIQANAQIGYAVPEDINRLLQSIVVLRGAYHKALRESAVYSRGYQYLRASEVVAEVDFDEFDEVWFCNFFYFNRSEKMIADSLYKQGKATFIFQGDQRKWPVLARIARDFHCSITESDKPRTPGFDLKLYTGFDVHSQIAHVREILKTITDWDKTVIVLPNPDHIIPLLSEIADTVKDFNISMGYPLKRSSLYALFEFMFKAQLSKKDDRYYTKDYLKAIRHPFIKNLKGDAMITRTLIHKLEEVLTGKEKTGISGSLFIALDEIMQCEEIYDLTCDMLKRLEVEVTPGDLRGLLRDIHQWLFAAWESVEHFEGFAQVLDKFIDGMIEHSPLKYYPLNVNIADKMYAINEEFKQSAFRYEHFSIHEMFRVFDHKVSREIVAFIGSPLKDLQLLGLFETRSLNFEHVIILDVNEGALPKLSIYEPLIPREVMISLNLDRLELEEEIQRYQFMRLISSAKCVHLVYQKSKDKEPSRFVEELVWEEQKKYQDKPLAEAIVPRQASFDVTIAPSKRAVKKTPRMIEFLKQHTYSASSINMYLRNPMDFYYSYVLGLREKEDLLDEPDARQVGTFIHQLLEQSFKPFLHKKPMVDQLFRKRFIRMFDEQFEQAFRRSMKSDSFLLRSVLIERLNRFLDHEQFNREKDIAKILYLESRFTNTINLSCGSIKFGYVVDRVDQLTDGTVMIVDYKTGSVDQMPKSLDLINAMELSREAVREHVKSFQVPLYFQYLDQIFPEQPINAALYNLRTLELKKFIDKRSTQDRDQINETFRRTLDFILSEILDPDVEFVECVL